MGAKAVGTYKAVLPIGIQSDFTTVDTTQQFPLGMVVKARDVSTSTAYGEVELMYVKGGTSIAATSAVTVNADYTLTLLAARAKGQVAVALSALTSTTATFGWVVIKGKAAVKSDSTISANAPLYIDGTSGRVDGTAVAGDQIIGAQAASTDDTNTIVINLVTYAATADYDNA